MTAHTARKVLIQAADLSINAYRFWSPEWIEWTPGDGMYVKQEGQKRARQRQLCLFAAEWYYL